MNTSTTDIISSLLRDVPRLAMETTVNDEQIIVCNDGPFVRYDRVLAALTTTLDGVDERAVEVATKLRMIHEWKLGRDASDLISALLAQNAALRAQIKGQSEIMAAWRDDLTEMALDAKEQRARAEAAEAKVKKLRRERDDALTFLDNAVSNAPQPLKALGKYLAGRLDEDEWQTAEQYLNAAAKACVDLTAAEAKVEKLREAAKARTSALNAFLDDWTDELPMEAVADLHRVAAGIWDDDDAALTTEESKS